MVVVAASAISESLILSLLVTEFCQVVTLSDFTFPFCSVVFEFHKSLKLFRSKSIMASRCFRNIYIETGSEVAIE